MPAWLSELWPIAALVAVIALVVRGLPKVDVGHSPAFLRRRFLNWFPLGLTYAFLYMGRYNLTVAATSLPHFLENKEFGDVSGIGKLVYGLSFLINGPLTDRLGGRRTILFAAGGATVANLGMGLVLHLGARPLFSYFAVLYALNMYFQSFGAVSIVKVNAQWFHLKERGLIGGVFGVLIALGVYFAFDWGTAITVHYPGPAVFWVPAAVLTLFFIVSMLFVRDTPKDAGHPDLETGDATWSTEGQPLSVVQVAKRMFTNPIILTIAAIELMSGFVRAAMQDWYKKYASAVGAAAEWVPSHWGLAQCIAGILGGVVAGIVSDRVFGSRRGPVVAVFYGVAVVSVALMAASLGTGLVEWSAMAIILTIIGVHGALSGTASMDFGGKRNVGVAAGLIDGCVYLGQAVQAVLLGRLLPDAHAPDAHLVSRWQAWPLAMLPATLIGLALATRLWNARAKPDAAAH